MHREACCHGIAHSSNIGVLACEFVDDIAHGRVDGCEYQRVGLHEGLGSADEAVHQSALLGPLGDDALGVPCDAKLSEA